MVEPSLHSSDASVALATGIAIARELAADAVWSGEACAFHGAAPASRLGLPAMHRSFGGDYYEGSAGIARFLALATAFAEDPALRTTTLGAIRHALARSAGYTLFGGRLGAGLVALEVAERLEQPALVQPAVATIEAACCEALSAAKRDVPCDLLSGLAGVVYGLVAALPYDLDGGWLAAACTLAQAVIDRAVEDEFGLSWPLHPGSADHLCGMGHGAAGIALAFEALAPHASDAGGLRNAARRARDFERQWYSPQNGSWADLRGEVVGLAGSGHVFPHMWCHGSVGVAAERLHADTSDLLAQADLVGALAGARAEAKRLLARACGPGAGDELNGSQCHGLSGMSDLFVDAWRRDGDDDWLNSARACTAMMRNDATRKEGWRCGVPGGLPTPGMMLGKAGIGWAHLRVASPQTVASAWRPGPVGSSEFLHIGAAASRAAAPSASGDQPRHAQRRR